MQRSRAAQDTTDNWPCVPKMFSGPGKVDQGPVYRSASSRPVFMLPQAPNNDTGTTEYAAMAGSLLRRQISAIRCKSALFSMSCELQYS